MAPPKSHDLSLHLRGRDLAATKASLVAFYAAGDRKYTFQASPDTSHTEKPGEPGRENSVPVTWYALNAWWLFGDKVALQTAFDTANWLIDCAPKGTWDGGHCQRHSAFAPLALAAMEAGISYGGASPDTLQRRYLSAFGAWVDWLLRDDVVNGQFTGGTFRPLVRVLCEAIHVAWLAEQLEQAGILEQKSDSHGVPRSGVLMAKGKASLKKFLEKKWDPAHGSGFGWRIAPGSWPTVQGPERLDDFPYRQGETPKDMATHVTFFMAFSILPYEGNLVYQIDKEFARECGLVARVRDIARHGLYWGYDPVLGQNMNAIGYKDGSNTLGCYAPGFSDGPGLGPLKDWVDRELADSKAEQLFHTPFECFFASQQGDDFVKKQSVNAIRRGARCVREGEVPSGAVQVATKFF